MPRKDYYHRNKELVAIKNAIYQAENKEKINIRRRRYASENRESVNAYASMWAKRNRSRIRSKEAMREAQRIQASPKWADSFVMSEIYDLARLRSELTCVDWHVDHIVPLRSSSVCGLHCESNLRVITAKENIDKGNRYWPDMP